MVIKLVREAQITGFIPNKRSTTQQSNVSQISQSADFGSRERAVQIDQVDQPAYQSMNLFILSINHTKWTYPLFLSKHCCPRWSLVEIQSAKVLLNTAEVGLSAFINTGSANRYGDTTQLGQPRTHVGWSPSEHPPVPPPLSRSLRPKDRHVDSERSATEDWPRERCATHVRTNGSAHGVRYGPRTDQSSDWTGRQV